jgi:alkaline phosphatase
MLTGVKPEVHRINFNSDPPKGAWPAVPTVLELAHEKGLTTGVFSTKSKFTLYTRPGMIDYVSISKESSSADDMASAKAAADAIKAHKPGAMLVHMGNNDKTGHAIGWGTPEQIAALEGADAGVGVVIAALKEAGIYDKTLIIISADHGGSGKGHGDKLDATTKASNGEKDWRSRYIPWIAVGPGVNKGYDLTRVRTLTVHTEDTFATACYFLGITPPGTIYGKPVTKIWTEKEPIVKPATARAGATAPVDD